MEKETFGFSIETAYGKAIKDYELKDANGNALTEIAVSAAYDKYQTFEEIPAKELPDNKEVLNYVNAKNKAKERASATTKALTDAGVTKPTLETSAEMRFNTIYKALLAGKIPDAEAKQQAAALTGYNAGE
jgi:hypothetical protein